MKCTIYANYGLLGHEKETIYHTANSAISDALTVEIPEALAPYMAVGGLAVMLPVNGKPTPYWLNEVLRADRRTNNPVIRWYDGNKRQTVALEIVEG